MKHQAHQLKVLTLSLMAVFSTTALADETNVSGNLNNQEIATPTARNDGNNLSGSLNDKEIATKSTSDTGSHNSNSKPATGKDDLAVNQSFDLNGNAESVSANSGSLKNNETPVAKTATAGGATKIEDITVQARRTIKPAERYQKTINRRKIETSNQGNGDVASMLRGMSNVQYDNSYGNSETPGEIEAAKISISGAQFYQNLITVDGVNIANKLDPADTSSLSPWYALPGTSQTVDIDVDLIDRITVMDSAISAKYGGFSGGVVETELRRPEQPFAFKLSRKFTNGNIEKGWPQSLTRYHLSGDEEYYKSFLGSFNKDKQPFFRKHVTQMSAESQINDQFGIIGSLNITESIIPLRQHNPSYVNKGNISPVDPADINGEQKDTKRKKTNALIKAYYDPTEDLNLELSYTYAPNFSREQFAGSGKGMYYDIEHGGHIFNWRTKWNNDWGKFTNTLNYQKTGDEVKSVGYTHTRDWQISDSKHWSSYSGVAREAGVISSERESQTLTNTFDQEFKPFKWGKSEHTITAGGEWSYTKAKHQFSDRYIARSARAMSSEMAEKCKKTNGFWCDLATAYDPDKYFKKDGTDAVQDYSWINPLTGQQHDMYYWPYGQYFTSAIHYDGGNPAKVSDNKITLFFEDDIKIPFGEDKKYGELTVRPGVRWDFNTYMKQHNIAPRFFTDYAMPWSGEDKKYSTHISGGYARYYGNNLYTYRLEDGIEQKQSQISRNDPGRSFEDIYAENRACYPSEREKDANGQWVYYHYDANGNRIEGQDSNCVTHYANATKFDKLKTPYDDEFMFGVSQDVGPVSIVAKYIHRNGRDQVIRATANKIGPNGVIPPSIDGYTDTYTYFTNAGKSRSNIITLDVRNSRPLMLGNIKNNFIFAFDWTNTKRNKENYLTSYSETDYTRPYILYDGQLMLRGERPADNFTKPFTVKLETTHEWNMLGGLWSLNNLFSFKQGYKKAVTASKWDKDGTEFGLPQDKVSVYEITKLPSTFSWDLKLGAEYTVHKKNKLFFNVDILNLMDKKNVTTASVNTNTGDVTPTYGTGRQFWFELGYKFH